MGIRGLHVLLKSIQKPCTVQKFSGQTLGVDAYGWLHRGLVACAVDLVFERPTTKHIDFVLSRVRMLVHFGVKPYIVFDGDNLPSKAKTEADRERKRQQSKELGMELLRTGKKAEAFQELQKAVDVTPYMARQLIEELKRMDVPYIVAPYEADAQLVYLEQRGIIDGIVSEDSDLLVFGAKRLLTKLDQYGQCIEINRSDFTACRDVSFVGWTDADFRRMCILSGCDYLPNITNLGLKKAYRGIHKYKSVEKTLRMLQLEGQCHVPAWYLDAFKQAELTFLYQRVFCPIAGKLVTLTPPDPEVNLDDLPFIGKDVEPEIATGVAQGNLDPTSKEPITLKPMPLKVARTGIVRRQTLGSSAELKANKPITSFLTPRRKPLAELDPNSLTPSPSQQLLLERHANTSWDASPAPLRSSLGLRRSITSLAVPHSQSSPQVGSAERTAFLAQASRISKVQPAKRPRLCSETEDDMLPSRCDTRSRFFTQVLPGSSPGGQEVGGSKKSRRTTIDVFSDDQAAEDLMSQLLDSPKPQVDSELSVSAAAEPIRESAAVAPNDRSLVQSKESEQLSTPLTKNSEEDAGRHGSDSATELSAEKSVSIDSDPEQFQRVLGYHVEKQNSKLFTKYAFQAGTSTPKVGRTEATAQKSSARPARPSGSDSQNCMSFFGSGAQASKRQRLTPLQRLGQSALTRSRTINISTTMRTPHAQQAMRTQTDTRTGGLGSVISSSVPQGSEDLLVAKSDTDEEEPSVDCRAPVTLDLKHFSFTPR